MPHFGNVPCGFLLLHDVIRSMLAARTNSGETDSGTQSRALQSYLTTKGMLFDVDQVLIAQLCMESVIFGSAPFYHVALVLIIALCKGHFLDCLHQWVLTSHHQIWGRRQFNHCKEGNVLISATTELGMIQAWGLHFVTKFAWQNVLVIKTGLLDWKEQTLFQNAPLIARRLSVMFLGT